ncbi:hypothetical protein [Herbaspirillum camelliae]|uniref:hypothetical protein n=1 Tax=Herbaspirillum camelliae TaxID=1892903 RepID=UPI000949F8A4|nr:hypothetical protein [Herbaspirillum camelliae]
MDDFLASFLWLSLVCILSGGLIFGIWIFRLGAKTKPRYFRKAEIDLSGQQEVCSLNTYFHCDEMPEVDICDDALALIKIPFNRLEACKANSYVPGMTLFAVAIYRLQS